MGGIEPYSLVERAELRRGGPNRDWGDMMGSDPSAVFLFSRLKAHRHQLGDSVHSVGRPSLDPGTFGLKGICGWLCGVALVENSLSFERKGVFSCRSGLVVLQKYEV